MLTSHSTSAEHLADHAVIPPVVEAEIDRLIANGASLADHEGRWPSHRELRSWYWSTAFDGRADCIRRRAKLLEAFGMSKTDAKTEAEAFATRHGYRPRQSGRKTAGPGPVDFAAINAAVRLEDLAARIGFELVGTGRTRSARCLLHREENGRSFTVWVEKQIWKCFGRCNRGGDSVRLVRLAMEAGLWR